MQIVLLALYCTVLLVLCTYGAHRASLVFQCMRYKRRIERASRSVTVPEGELPTVTVQLPLYNEATVVRRLLDAAGALDYPSDRLELQVLDDSTDETEGIARAAVDELRERGINAVYLRRPDRHGYKAGALDFGLQQASGELIAIFDADFVPQASFLRDIVGHFADPRIGMVQTRWEHMNRNHSLLTSIQALMLDGHHMVENRARFGAGNMFNFSGTGGMWRRQAIADAGGWEHDTLTEDLDLSYRAQLAGWKFKYLQDVECPAELPIEMTAFKTQQARWAKGLIQTGKKILPKVFKSKAPFRIKVEAFYHLSANLSYPLMIVLSTLLMPAMIIRSFGGWFQMLVIDLPLFMASTFSISSFYLVSQKELFPRRWPRTFLFLPFLMALGIGLTLTNTRAVIEALLGVKSSFKRTPKYAVQSKADKAQGQKYRRRLGIVPWLELLVGTYFVGMCAYAFTSGNYWTIPFLLLFVLGYWYTGLMSLLQGRFERRGGAAREPHTKPFPVGV